MKVISAHCHKVGPYGGWRDLLPPRQESRHAVQKHRLCYAFELGLLGACYLDLIDESVVNIRGYEDFSSRRLVFDSERYVEGAPIARVLLRFSEPILPTTTVPV